MQSTENQQGRAAQQCARGHDASVAANGFEIQPASQVGDKQQRQANGFADAEERQVQVGKAHGIAEVFEVGAHERLAQIMVLGVAHKHDQQPQGQHVYRTEIRPTGDQVQQAHGECPGTAMQQPAAQGTGPARARHQQHFDCAGQEKTKHDNRVKSVIQKIRHRNPATAK
ncbi:hypothetical protein D3C85_1444520 [compost metagenome]